MGAVEAQDVADLEAVEDLVENRPPNVSDVELDEGVVVGALAIEKLRRLPSFKRISTYCPARNWRRSVAGSRRWSSMTSAARRSSFSMRAGRVLTGISLAARTSLHSRLRSAVGLAQQKAPAWRPCRRRSGLGFAVVHRAVEDLALQKAAGAVAAAVGQGQAVVQRCVEDGFIGGSLKVWPRSARR